MAEERINTSGDVVSLPAGMRPKTGLVQTLVDFAKKKPLGAAGGIIFVGLILVALAAPLIATHNPTETNYRAVLAQPGTDMLLGGDQLGRDVFSRLVYGTRVSLLVGILSVASG